MMNKHFKENSGLETLGFFWGGIVNLNYHTLHNFRTLLGYGLTGTFRMSVGCSLANSECPWIRTHWGF